MSFRLAAKKHGVVIVASLFRKIAAARVYRYNTAVIIDAGRDAVGKVPEKPHSGRQSGVSLGRNFYFTPGDLGYCAWKYKGRAHRRI